MPRLSRSHCAPRRWISLLLVVLTLGSLFFVSLAAERSPGAQQSDQERDSSESPLAQDSSQQDASAAQPSDATTAAAASSGSSTPREPPIVLEITTSDYDGDVVWENARNHQFNGASKPTARGTTPTLAERQQFVERMQATLDTLLARYEAQGAHVLEGEHQTINELRQLIDEAAPLLTAELLRELPDLYEQIVDAQTLAEDMLEENDDAIPPDDLQHALIRELDPSDAFLDIEDRILDGGLTPETVDALHRLAREEIDVFAHETLAYIELFDPNVSQHHDFTSAFAHLRVATDAGRGHASSLLAMLSLIDFGVPRNASLPITERRQIAQELLMDLAREQDFTASLVVAYRMLTGEMTGVWKSDTCQNAVQYYYRTAESNVQQLTDMGGERGPEFGRLSEEFEASGAASTLHDPFADDAAQQFEYFRSIAGNPMDEQWIEATERLGEMYFYGDDAAGVRQDYAQATDHFRRAADAGEPVAQANYGMMLAQGIGTKQDNVTAIKYFERAAAQGNGFAMHCIGVMYLTGGGVPKNETRAFEWFQKAASFGYIEAHTYLGSAYLQGRGVERNETLAFEHFSEAATTESSQALFNLGVMYYRGAGIKRSCPLAVKNFRRVATQPALLADLPFSMEKAYECYKQGDYLRAYLQYRLLSEFGSEEAQTNAAFLLEQFGDRIFSSNVNSLDATLDAGEDASRLPPVWMGPPKHPLTEAMALYERAAALNDTQAIRKTGACHYEGWHQVCEKNASRAIERYEKAAQLGDAEAAFNCGAMYSTADGVGRDLDEAKRFFSMCTDAMFPENVPCVLALSALHLVVVVRDVFERVVALVPAPLLSMLPVP